ncbi:hypothetical protein Acr_00g0067010 [Actinidia rufa]|uniref:Uncharacterized protein n=1 Tax=Actinidia rufa TaxID=165716 RepID=A0A7J0DQB4_9ERIC|nr:hypothetical protein Acr_00g0067010 [Actinidia rufa]
MATTAALGTSKNKNVVVAATLVEAMADRVDAAMLHIEICPSGVRLNKTKADLKEPLEYVSNREDSEEESDAVSRTLGDDDLDNTLCVRQNASKKDEIVDDRAGLKLP